jgi:hypothetical protein
LEKEDYISKEISKLAQFIRYLMDLVFTGNKTEAEEKIDQFLSENKDMSFLNEELKSREDFITYIDEHEISIWKLQLYSEILDIRSEVLMSKGINQEAVKSLTYSIYLLDCLTLKDQLYDSEREKKIRSQKEKLLNWKIRRPIS